MRFDTFKWRPGTDWEAMGPDFHLGLKKKGYDSSTFEECVEIAPILNDLKFLFFEQPMGNQGSVQFEDHLKLKTLMPDVELWNGETFRSLSEAQPWIEAGIYDAV